MTNPLTVAGTIHIDRAGRGGRQAIVPGSGPALPEPGRVPRVARLMALAIRFDGLVRDGVVADYAALARLGHVTRARVTQVMNLLLLAPDVQEELLFLPRVDRGREPLVLRDLQPIAAVLSWAKQRRLWQELQGRTAGKSATSARPSGGGDVGPVVRPGDRAAAGTGS